MFAAKNELLTRPSGGGGYQISRSLRFNSADSPYLSRTPSSTSSQTTATFSAWVKRSRLGSAAENRMFAESTGSGAGLFWVLFTTSDQIQIVVNGSGTGITTTQVFRDPSAYYHVVVAVDTTQATSSNRIKLYVNGSQVTAFTGTQTYYSLNETLKFNVTTTTNYIGYSNSQAFDGYMTEVNWIDGQQLTPSSFGETNADTGVWQPKAFSGTYGTNGFELNFSDNSNTTAATLGKDYSGNGNNWTPNNFSVSSGAGNDSLVDSPTSYGIDTGVGGTVRGNYATLNPLSVLIGTTSNGNLDGDTGTTNGGVVYATMNIPNSGKWYWEYTQTNTGTSFSGIETVVSSTGASIPNTLRYIGDGTKEVNGTITSYGASYGNTDIIGTAVDVDVGTVTFYKNGTSQGAITYATASINITPSWRDGSGSVSLSYSANFGQRPFAYTAPSGFKALCTQNLPTPTIGATTATQAGKYFNTVLYTGNGTSLSVTGVGFQPDFSWLKARSAAFQHGLFDAVRGSTKALVSNNTNAETTYDSIASFNSDGFSLAGAYNTSPETYVGWNWKANGSGSSNTSGSITSTVSASTTSGFSVVTYTGTGANATVGHGLGVAPKMYIIKCRSNTDFWPVWHTSIYALNQDNYLGLNFTSAASAYSGVFTNVAPTSTTFAIGTDTSTNTSTRTYVAYCFAEVAGYSKAFSYTANGSTDGPFVYLGFRPAFILLKGATVTGAWWLIDCKRSTYNLVDKLLFANLSNAEDTYGSVDLLSNGFKIRNNNSDDNTGTYTYIGMAFAEFPFKYSLAR